MINVFVATRKYKKEYKALVNITNVKDDWYDFDLKDILCKEYNGEKSVFKRGKSFNNDSEIMKFTEGQKLIPNDIYALIYDEYLLPGFDLIPEFNQEK